MNDALLPGTGLGPYQIDSLIGAGGMGQVYRAHDARLGRNVAIKTLSGAGATDPDLLRRFETEARAAGGLDHPNLLVVYDVGREGGVSYIVSELLDGETVRARLRNGALPMRQAIDYTIQIARGLAAAHARGIVHRDLKPENLFLTRDGRLKILDFGVAKLIDAPRADAATTDRRPFHRCRRRRRDGRLHGAGAGAGRADRPSRRHLRARRGAARDAIGRPGVPARHDSRNADRHLRDDPPELAGGRDTGPPRIVGRCLEKRPEDRFHSAHDLGLALELLSTANRIRPPSAPDRAPGVPRRKALMYGAASVGALVASGLAGGGSRRPARIEHCCRRSAV